MANGPTHGAVPFLHPRRGRLICRGLTTIVVPPPVGQRHRDSRRVRHLALPHGDYHRCDGTFHERGRVRRACLIWCLVLGAAGCSFGNGTAPPSTGSGIEGSTSTGAVQPSLALSECPVTPPGGPRPPTGLPPKPYIGNGRLWVGLWPRGLVIVPPDDISRRGVLRMKFMWWRGSSVHGVLHISGSQLAADGVVRGRTTGYGLTGFNASSIYFSGQGCYRVTGRAGGATLSFVTLVRTCSVLHELTPRVHAVFSSYLAKNWCPA